ncbi:MAG: hypothetical protein AB1490_20075 [Pseudomonadota bacterium]
MNDDHQEAYADFPGGILVGGIVIAFAVSIVLSVFVFGGGGHGTAVATNTPAATQQKH